jgi:MFS family permease
MRQPLALAAALRPALTLLTTVGAPLRHPTFRGLMSGAMPYYLAGAMQTTAAAWMMVELTGSDFLAALVQTAVFLPMFLLALPAGVLGDIADRARLIQRAVQMQAAASVLLAVLALTGVAGPGLVLLLIFITGCCTALQSPSWNSSVVDAVPREELPQAITVISIAYNLARALGPALAGVLFALGSAGLNFAVASAGVAAMAWSIHRWPPRPHPPSRLPAERLWGGMASALRFAWHAPTVFAQLARTSAYTAAGSALWALLPVVAQRQLGLGSAGFGLLMGFMGGGAVVAGFVIARLRQRHGVERIVQAGCIVYALALAVCALSPWALPVYAVLPLAGASWMTVTSTFNAATQTSAPPWVRSRAMAMHTLCSLGAFAIGSAIWGAMSGLTGLTPTLLTAAALMLAGPLLAHRYPLRMGEASDVTQTEPSRALSVLTEPEPEAGPVAVEIAYRVRPGAAAAFLDAIALMRATRQRDGAGFWRVYRDLSYPDRFVERFIVRSWAAYLHQRARTTEADLTIEARLREFMVDGAEITTSHYIAER